MLLFEQVVRIEADHDFGVVGDEPHKLARVAAQARAGQVLDAEHRADLFGGQREATDGVGRVLQADLPFFVGDRLRTGMEHEPLRAEDRREADHPLHKRDVLFAQRRIGYRDVELAAERQVAGPDFQSGFFEQRLDAVGPGVTFVLGSVAPEIVEDNLHVVDARGFDLREFFGLRDLHHAERYAQGVFGPDGSSSQQKGYRYEQ